MPAFIALAASRTSGTNRIPSRKSMPTMRMPSTSASSSTRVGGPAAAEQDVRALGDLVGDAVVEVVVHLLGQLVVDERREVDLLSRPGAMRVLLGRRAGVPHRGTVPYDGTARADSSQRSDVQSPVDRAAFAVLGALSGRADRRDRGRRARRRAQDTAARLLASLAREGVVEQVPGDTRYRLGPRSRRWPRASGPRAHWRRWRDRPE